MKKTKEELRLGPPIVRSGPFKGYKRVLGKPRFFNRIKWAYEEGIQDLDRIQFLILHEKKFLYTLRTDLTNKQRRKRVAKIKTRLKEAAETFKGGLESRPI